MLKETAGDLSTPKVQSCRTAAPSPVEFSFLFLIYHLCIRPMLHRLIVPATAACVHSKQSVRRSVVNLRHFLNRRSAVKLGPREYVKPAGSCQCHCFHVTSLNKDVRLCSVPPLSPKFSSHGIIKCTKRRMHGV